MVFSIRRHFVVLLAAAAASSALAEKTTTTPSAQQATSLHDETEQQDTGLADSTTTKTTDANRDLQVAGPTSLPPPPPDDDDAYDDDIDFGFDDDFALEQIEEGDYDFSCCFNIAEILYDAPDFEFLSKAFDLTDLDIVIAGPGPFTLFAPTDDAFYDFIDKAPFFATNLFEDPWVEHLAELLAFHVVVDEELIADEFGGDFFPGQQIETGNDEVIFVDLGETVELTPSVTEDYAGVILPNVEASSGVIHVIDAVLQPEFFSQSILDRGIMEDYTFFFATKLVGIDDIFDSPKPITVFVPDDEAFDEAFTDDEADFLLSPEGMPILQIILEFHTVEGVWPETLFPEGETVELTPLSEDLEFDFRGRRLGDEEYYYNKKKYYGEEYKYYYPPPPPDVLYISVDDSDFVVNDADVIESDLLANNGIYHLIDTVLIPPSLDGVDLTGRIPYKPPKPFLPKFPMFGGMRRGGGGGMMRRGGGGMMGMRRRLHTKV